MAGEASTSSTLAPSTATWKWIAAVAVVIVLVAGWFFLPVAEWAAAFQRWVEDLGPWGYALFAAVYIVGTVLLVPVSVLTVVAGLVFGLAAGFALVVVSATLGATLAFLIARFGVRGRVERAVFATPKFHAVTAAVTEGGWKIVALLRLSPVVPFNLQNYFYGITGIAFLPYVAATFFGIMPGTLLYVYLGAAGKAAASEGGGPLKWAFFALGLVATIAAALLVARQAQARLKAHGVGPSGLAPGEART